MMSDRLHDRLATISIGWLGSMERLVKFAPGSICALAHVHHDHPPLTTIAPAAGQQNCTCARP